MNKNLIPVYIKYEYRCPQTKKRWTIHPFAEELRILEDSPERCIFFKYFDNFEEAFSFLQKEDIPGCFPYYSIFKRPIIILRQDLHRIRISKRKFKWLEIRKSFEPKENASMVELSKKLPSQEFIDFCKNKGINIYFNK